ncbi:MAG: penicillin-binding protein 2 [Deltaproteobacteria bacterium]|nr:penicillin-binding protein 2 [Deltaproteobacteria bacterium]
MNIYLRQNDTETLKERSSIVTGVGLAIFFILLSRLWFLQVLKGSEFRELSENNRVRLVKTVAPRGVIFDKNGKVLVENRPSFDLFIVPEDVRDWERLKGVIPRLIDIKREDIEKRLSLTKGRPPFQPIKIKEDLVWEEVVRVETFKIDLPGVMLTVGPKRNYLYGDLISHITGYLGEVGESELKGFKRVGYRLGDYIGKHGVEKTWEEYLKGITGGRQIEVDAFGREMKTLQRISPIPGHNLYLTIDLDTQLAARMSMQDKVGAVVAMDPQNGRILTLLSNPSFDPNLFATGIGKEDWVELTTNPFHPLENKAIQGLYPPASLYKVITAAAALEEGIITPRTKIYSGPTFRFGNREFRDWKEEGHGVLDVHRAIVESADTFFYQVGLKVGIDRLAYYAKGFGLGKRTGIGLPHEKAGLVPTSRWKKEAYGVKWYEGETVSAAVGQGYLQVTPLQMVTAYAAIANRGRLFLPHIVDRVETLDGETAWRSKPQEIGRLPLSRETIDVLKKALWGVVNEEGGTGRIVKIEGVDVAGKTGTAQVVRLKENAPRRKPHEIPYEQRDHAWFVGFAPADNPKIVLAILVEHGGFGASAAAPVAREVIKAYLSP